MASFWLEFEQGGQTQQASFEKDTVTLGRDRSSDFVLDHPTVSRQHALIVHQGGGAFQLVVLSRGGLTAVDGQRVEDSEIDLYDGASLTLGQYTVRFRSQQAPGRPASGGAQPQGAPAGAAGGAGNFGGGAAQPQGAGNNPGAGGGLKQPAGGLNQPGASGSGGSSLGGGLGQSSGNAQSGGAATGSQPGLSGGQPPPEGQEEPEDGPGIKSWDEIAASSEEEGGRQGDGTGETEERRGLQQIRQNSGDDESNPLLIGAGVVGAVVFLGFALLSGGGDDQTQATEEQVPIEEQQPVEINIECYEPTTCRQEAEEHYERGMDLIERRTVETGNLFKGYHRLLQARRALEEAGVEEIPEEEMPEWQNTHDMARQELSRRFRDFRMRYHQADQRDHYGEMASVLEEIKATYPDRTARENQWAREHERAMKAEGIYPQ